MNRKSGISHSLTGVAQRIMVRRRQAQQAPQASVAGATIRRSRRSKACHRRNVFCIIVFDVGEVILELNIENIYR